MADKDYFIVEKERRKGKSFFDVATRKSEISGMFTGMRELRTFQAYRRMEVKKRNLNL